MLVSRLQEILNDSAEVLKSDRSTAIMWKNKFKIVTIQEDLEVMKAVDYLVDRPHPFQKLTLMSQRFDSEEEIRRAFAQKKIVAADVVDLPDAMVVKFAEWSKKL